MPWVTEITRALLSIMAIGALATLLALVAG